MGFPKLRLRWKVVLGIAGACLLLLLMAVWSAPPPRVKLLAADPRFHLVSARLLTSTNQPFYLGGQTEGRMRDFLRTRCHLKVKPLPNCAPLAFSLGMRGTPKREVAQPSYFALHFALADSPLNGSPTSVELRDPAGNTIPVKALARWDKAPYWQLLDLDADRYLSGNYHVRVMQAGKCLAEFEVRDLPRVRHTSL